MSQEKSSPVTFAVLPYLSLKGCITIGDVTFWPFYKECNERIKDDVIRENLRRRVSCYVRHLGNDLEKYIKDSKIENADVVINGLKEALRKNKVAKEISDIFSETQVCPQYTIYDVKYARELLNKYLESNESHINKDEISNAIQKLSRVTTDVGTPPLLEPIKSIAIASIGDKPYLENEEGLKKVRTATNALFLSCFVRSISAMQASNQNILSACTTDNFMIYALSVPTSESSCFAVSEGTWIRTLDGGLQCSTTRFTVPLYINLLYEVGQNSFDKGLTEALYKAAYTDNDICKRITRSISIFYQVLWNSPIEVDFDTRILLLAEAFEILLDLEERGTAKDFRNKIKDIVGGKDEPIVEQIDTSNGKEGLTEKQNWAHKFYKLRSRIIHGDDVRNEDKRFTSGNGIDSEHFSIAVMFFVVCLEEMLEKADVGYECPDTLEITEGIVPNKSEEERESRYKGPFYMDYGRKALNKCCEKVWKEIGKGKTV